MAGLIYFQGLNCHIACLVNIAHLLGVRYTDAFAELWSEWEFTDEKKYNVLVSARVQRDLAALGVVSSVLPCGAGRECLGEIGEGELLLVGMDTFYIPWHPVYGHFSGHHYFFARTAAGELCCYDPIYGNSGEIIPAGQIAHAFEVAHVYRVQAERQQHTIADEARAVLRDHPATAAALLAELERLRGCRREQFESIIKQVTALQNNRLMYARHVAAAEPGLAGLFEALLPRWEAVKNGLYKATIMLDNRAVTDEVAAMLGELMQDEAALAKMIVAQAEI